MNSNKIQKVYEQRVSELILQRIKWQGQDRWFNLVRLGSFLILLIFIYFLFQFHWGAGLASIYFALFGFYKLIDTHNKLKDALLLNNQLLELNKAELKVQEYDFSYFDEGSEYLDALHPYCNDLDLFGKQSLYQMMSRCTSIPGKNKLASLLKNPISKEKIETYQDCNRELENNIEFRQVLFALGKANRVDKAYRNEKVDKKELDQFLDWVAEDRNFTFSIPLVFLLFLVTTAIFILLIVKFSFTISFLAFIFSAYLMFKNNEKVSDILAKTAKNSQFLKNYSKIILHIEGTNFEAPHLRRLKSQFSEENISASKELRQLAYYTRQLELKYNFFGILINLFFLYDHYYSTKIEDWKEKNKSLLLSWFDAMADFEALNSISTLAYNNPDWEYPHTQDEKQIRATAVGHPLIHADKRITNDLIMPTLNHIKIVTGSNMGGKSTFLRTVGINVVLAQLGSKVCASEFYFPLIDMITSIRTEDNLSENTSSFYAELKRLKIIIDAVKEQENTLFLLDEILKGTNSNDRHKGAKAIIKQLLNKHGAGLISTHDLELGNLVTEHPDQIENICFEVEVTGDELSFDYKLRKGISKSFNATQLMRNIGIDI